MTHFTCVWCNRLDQFDSVTIDLLITHDEAVIPDFRVTKHYHLPYDDVDADFLETAALAEIERLVDAWEQQQEVLP